MRGEIRSIEEFTVEQTEDAYCREAATQEELRGSKFHVNHLGRLDEKSIIDGCLQKMSLVSLRERILNAKHCREIAGNQVDARRLKMTRKIFFWPHMAIHVCETVRNCAICGRRLKHKQNLQLLSVSGPLELFAIDILGALRRKNSGSTFFTVVTDRNLKFTRAIPTSRTMATNTVNLFLDRWIDPYGKPDFLLTDNGPRFVGRFFAKFCGFLRVKHIATTPYHSQTNGKVERYNKVIVAHLRRYFIRTQE